MVGRASLLVITLVAAPAHADGWSCEAAGTWQESHFKWRISSVLWAGVLYLVTLPLYLLLYLPGAIAWAVISIWFLYRIVKGRVRMNAGRPVTG